MAEKRKDSKGRLLRTGESQRKDGKYQYRYIDPEGERQTIYSWRLTETDRMPSGKKNDDSLREKEEEILNKLSHSKNTLGGKITLNDMFDKYITRKKYKGKPLNDTTVSNYLLMWNKNIRNKREANLRLTDIVKDDIVSLYEALQAENFSYGTISFYNKILSAIFNMALDDDLILKNPTKRCMNEIAGKAKLRDALTLEQQEGLIEYAREHNYPMYTKIVFLIDTMCRLGEFAGLTFKEIDLGNKWITINHQLRYRDRYYISPPKSSSGFRTIPMTDRVYNIIKEKKKYYFINKKDYVIDGYSDFLFYSKRGKLITSPNFNGELMLLVDKYNETAVHKIGHISAHVLRHTGCTRYAEKGIDLKVLQYLMGHSTTQITNDVYNHVSVKRATINMKDIEVM